MTRIAGDMGGPLGEYLLVFAAIRDAGERVMIDGSCFSACTLVTALIPRDKICITERAMLGFHAGWFENKAGERVTSPTGTRVLYVQHGSFDTHVGQKATQDRLLGEFSDAIKAFYDDLGAHGNDNRVLTMTFSEFGRRVAENASRGTDHGEASPLFLVGGGVKGGIYGAYPDLANTNMGNLKFDTDFRSVYATVLERWLGRPSAAILQGQFPTIAALG